MVSYEPCAGFREALTQLDLGEADLIVTTEADATQWAERHGYLIVREVQDGAPIFEIRPGGRGVLSPADDGPTDSPPGQR
jgi:hypothetical protein